MSLEIESVYLREVIDEVFNYLSKKELEHIIINGFIRFKWKISFSNNNINLVNNGSSYSLSIFMTCGESSLYINLNNLGGDYKDYLDKVIKKCSKIKTTYRYIPPNVRGRYYDIIPGGYSNDIYDIDKAIDSIGSFLSDISNEIEDLSGSLNSEGVKHIIKTSYGVDGEYKYSNFVFNIKSKRSEDFIYTINRIAPSIDLINLDEVSKELEMTFNRDVEISTIKEGNYRVIFSPSAFGYILNYIGTLLSGYSIYSGYSPFIDKLGYKLTDLNLSIYDDPYEGESPVARVFDEEGILRNRIYFIKEGILNSYALNTKYANILKLKPTGHAGIIYPEPYSMAMDSEEKCNYIDLLNDAGDFILINNLWKIDTLNYVSGDFSVRQRDIGFYMKGDKVKYAFNNVKLYLNVYDLFKNIYLVGGKSLWVKPSDSRIPTKSLYIAIDNVKVEPIV